MLLVVDTNILFSFFRENPVRSIIINSDSLGLKLFSPEYAFEELKDNKSDLLRYSKITEKELEFILSTLKSFIEIKPSSFFKEYRKEATNISPDIKDSPFFALALKLNAEIWSNEPRLKKQSSIKVWSTKDLREFLNA